MTLANFQAYLKVYDCEFIQNHRINHTSRCMVIRREAYGQVYQTFWTFFDAFTDIPDKEIRRACEDLFVEDPPGLD